MAIQELSRETRITKRRARDRKKYIAKRSGQTDQRKQLRTTKTGHVEIEIASNLTLYKWCSYKEGSCVECKDIEVFMLCNMNNTSQPIKETHHCQLPTDILMCICFDEAIQDINESAVLKDWFIVLVNADVNPAC